MVCILTQLNSKVSALLAYDDSGAGNVVVRLSTVGLVACVGHNYATVVRSHVFVGCVCVCTPECEWAAHKHQFQLTKVAS